MSASTTIPQPPADYVGLLNRERFLAACRDAGVPVGQPKAVAKLRQLVSDYRKQHNLGRPVSRKVVTGWLNGSSDPSMGAAGRHPSIYELAGVLEVSVDWLLSGHDPRRGKR